MTPGAVGVGGVGGVGASVGGSVPEFLLKKSRFLFFLKKFFYVLFKTSFVVTKTSKRNFLQYLDKDVWMFFF